MYCTPLPDLAYGIFTSDAPLLMYVSHLSGLLFAIVVGIMVWVKARKILAARVFVGIVALFAILSVLDIFLWVSRDTQVIMYLWSHWFVIYGLIFILGFYFQYTFITKRDVPLRFKALSLLLLAPIFLVAPTKYTLESIHIAFSNCNALESPVILNYTFLLSFLVVIGMLVLGYVETRKLHKDERKQAYLITAGIILFVLSFSASAYSSSILNIISGGTSEFDLEQYGFFGMTAFVGVLTYLIVAYRAFNIKLVATQVLVVLIASLVGSQILISPTPTSRMFSIITFVLVFLAGYFLIRSVKKEIAAREHIENLAKELEIINTQQTNLIHFITHQVKGFFTKTRNIFSAGIEGDFGDMSDLVKRAFKEGKESDDKAVEMVQELLNATNIRRGTVEYEMKNLDLAVLLPEIVTSLNQNAVVKNVVLTTKIDDGRFIIRGDELHIRQAIRNLIDNSIKYTPAGTIEVCLKRRGNSAVVSVKDSGIGISHEDMGRLFTEGGHGKDSRKVNTESTGYGLFIVKNVIEQHKGRVTVYSEGVGTGSTFTIDLPLAS